MAFRIEHRIGVAAPASEIWDLVYDLEGWKDWTELYSHASGKLAIGETLNFTFKVGDEPDMSVKGVVYDWVPEHQIAWTVKLYGGLVTSLRYIEIIKLGETNCILANGDYWNGPLARFILRKTRAQARAAFQRMNEIAKSKVETAWIARGGATVDPIPDPEGLTLAALKPLQPTVGRTTPWGFGKRKAGSIGLSK